MYPLKQPTPAFHCRLYKKNILYSKGMLCLFRLNVLKNIVKILIQSWEMDLVFVIASTVRLQDISLQVQLLAEHVTSSQITWNPPLFSIQRKTRTLVIVSD